MRAETVLADDVPTDDVAASPVADAAVLVRRVVPGDWPLLRSLRLEALLDTPLAYLETHADAAAAPEGEWRYRAVRGSTGGDSLQLLALRAGGPVGTAVTFLGEDDVWWVAAVYLQPAERGRGLLRRLVDALAAHAHGAGGRLLRLEVHEDNPRARAAYARLGFVETGGRRPYPLGDGDELELERRLPAPGVG